MRSTVLSALLVTALVAPAHAQGYPVQGKWGQTASTEKGAMDCSDKRVIEFSGDQRTDSNGGVPAYHNQSVTKEGTSSYRIVDEFSTGQISAGRTSYTLRQVDPDHIEMNLQQGGSVTLQRCK
jgi:hypothetical protein